MSNEHVKDQVNISNLWPLASMFFDGFKVGAQNVDSYNMFVSHDIGIINQDLPPLVAEFPEDAKNEHWKNTSHEIWLGEHSFSLPQAVEGGNKTNFQFVSSSSDSIVRISDAASRTIHILPKECRLRKLSYTCRMFVDVHHKINKLHPISKAVLSSATHVTRSVHLADIPVIVRSMLCAIPHQILLGKTVYQLGEDEDDVGGYFIINGVERELISQVQMTNNLPFIFRVKNEPDQIMCELRSCVSRNYRAVNATYIVYKPCKKGVPTESTFRCTIPFQRKSSVIPDFSAIVLLRALGAGSDREVFRLIVNNLDDNDMMALVRHSVEEQAEAFTESQALESIGRKCLGGEGTLEEYMRAGRKMLQEDLFPHVGTGLESLTPKAYFLGYCIHKILQVKLGRRPEDSKDRFMSKRVKGTGPLCSELYFHQLRNCRSDASKTLLTMLRDGHPIDPNKLFKSRILSDGFRYAIATGNWVANKSPGGKSGVSVALARLCPLATLSHKTRLNTPIDKDGKLTAPRKLNPTHPGKTCPYDTPEGIAVGLTNNHALVSLVSRGEATHSIRTIVHKQPGFTTLEQMNQKPAISKQETPNIIKSYRIFVNHALIGSAINGPQFAKSLIAMRRSASISFEIGVAVDYKFREIHIATDRGRFLRPLIPITSDELPFTKADLESMKFGGCSPEGIYAVMASGGLELIDAHEEMTLMIATCPSDLRKRNDDFFVRYTHCELHPSLVLGVSASIIPFPNMNPSPKNIYQCSMGKQAVAGPLPNESHRSDSSSHSLWYTQKPVVSTKAADMIGLFNNPAGVNLVVAVCSFSGYNQEDAVILNQSSIDRGLFISDSYRIYNESEKMVGNAYTERICAIDTSEPPEVSKALPVERGQMGKVYRKHTSNVKPLEAYTKLEADGVVYVGARVAPGDVIISKVASVHNQFEKTNLNEKYPITHIDKSLVNRTTEHSVVEHVMVSQNLEGSMFTSVKLRTKRVPVIGDKFSSRFGQKGTCGMTCRSEDMPFTQSGIVPDLILNPHAFPSRMTLAQMNESISSKIGCMTGNLRDGTPFENQDHYLELQQLLLANGFQPSGNERLHNPHTGQPFRTDQFFGVVFYQRLKHFVDDKIHSRSRGPVDQTTRQPVEGRSREGGLRTGEMERDCLISHGASATLKSRLMTNSDYYVAYVCSNPDCGRIGFLDRSKDNKNKTSRGCLRCMNLRLPFEMVAVELPYAFKLLVQELNSMSIHVKMNFK